MNVGRGTLDEMRAADHTRYNRWIVPPTASTERRYYQLLTDASGDAVLIDGRPNWYLRTGRVLEESDPIVTADGIVEMRALLSLLTTDYRAIVRAGLIPE